jgi:SAM-dependent methyltransferase
MSHPGQVKEDIRARYDNLGAKILQDVQSHDDLARLWGQVEGFRPALAYFRRRKIETALSLASVAERATLVEVGCGTGDYSFLLSRLGYRMIGVDLSPKSVEAAREKAGMLGCHETVFLVSDAETLIDLPDNSADGVVSFSTLRYVPSLDLALQAIHRVLRPQGTAVFDFPNRYCPWFRLLKNRFGVETHMHDHYYSASEIATRVRKAGFQAVETRTILFTPYVLPTTLLPVFKHIDRIGEKIPILCSTAGIIMARGVKA